MDEFAGEGFVLLVGPSPRLSAIAPLLSALGERLAGEAAAVVRTLDDLGDLAAVAEPYGRALLDAENIPTEDLGILRRFLLAHPGIEVWLAGESHDSPAARRLSTYDGIRLTPWPLDVEQLTVFAEPFAFEDGFYDDALSDEDREEAGEDEAEELDADDDSWAEEPPPEAPRTRIAPLSEHHDDPEMAAIAGILSTHDLRDTRSDPAPDHDPVAAPAPRAEPFTPAPSGSELPPFYREQIADLADIVQRLRLSVGAAHDSGDAGAMPRLAELDGEVARLQQFTRTLGYMVAPPAPGSQEFDVAVVLEEMLGTIASGPDAPRFLFKGGEPMIVRSDKALLFQAFDALLQVAAGCGSAGETVRVSVEPSEGPEGSAAVCIRVSFPAGPLAVLAPSEIVRPYALKRFLPAIGPNALAAAQGIVVGQGGTLALVNELESAEPRSDRLAWEARLPRRGTGSGARGNGRDGGPGPDAGPFD